MARIEDILGCCPKKNRRGSLREKFLKNETEYSSEIREMNVLVSSETGIVKEKKKKAVHMSSPLPTKDYESLDYDTSNNVPYKQWLETYGKFTYWHISLMRWVVVGFIGFFTGLIAFLINVGIFYLRHLKFKEFLKVYDVTQNNGMIFLGLLVLIGFNGFYALIAGILVAIEPIAAGSGIPEIKCYLNGIKMPRVARVRTLIAKAVGVLFSVAGGFLVGKEGPMIHSGAIVGAGIPQLRTFLWKKLKLPYPYFREDKDKRDFVSCGAAAGVAAAFGAPIGGVLFSLEEGSSFWDQGLTWRSLFCAMCSTITLNLFLTATPLVPHAKFGELDRPGLIDFGRFSERRSDNLWTIQYLGVFIVMGGIGGLLGAWFNSLNKRLTIYRMKHVFKKNIVFKVMEAVLIGLVTTLSVFLLSTFFGTCVPVIQGNEGQNFVNSTESYFCPPGITFVGVTFSKTYNDMATLAFNSEEDAIKQLFHQNGAFTLATLGIAFIFFYFIACWTYGSGVPSGLFVPCLTIGALYGRFFITAAWAVGWRPPINAGTFALIGAAAFLGGVVRMTVSLTVILIESTDEIEYGLPLLVTLMTAKWVGDLFNEGLYDIHIEIREIPLLGWDSPEKMDRLNATDVMNRDLKYIYPITRVRSIERLLRVTRHNAFLVVTPLTLDPNNEDDRLEQTYVPQLYERRSILPTYRQKIIEQRLKTVEGLPNKRSTGVNSTGAHTIVTSYQSNGTNMDIDGNDRPLIFHGIILRSQLVELLRNEIYFNESSGVESQPLITHQQLTKNYPRFKTIYDIHLSDGQKEMLMDVSLYMNPCPYTISYHAPLPRVFNLFRTMGLRHLPVIEDSGIVVGMITRHDLTHEHLHHVLHNKSHQMSLHHGDHAEIGDDEDGGLDVSTRLKRTFKLS